MSREVLSRREFLCATGVVVGAVATGVSGCSGLPRPTVDLWSAREFTPAATQPERAVFLSDLHVGAFDGLDDWTSDAGFPAFMREVVQPFTGRQDLVLAGDIIDLWESSDPGYRDRDLDGVELPRRSQTTSPLHAQIVAEEVEGIERAHARHPSFFTALKAALEADPDLHIYFTEGNHDHSLHSTSGQEVLRAILGGAAEERVHFSRWYECPELAVYAEHGHHTSYVGPEGVLAADLNCRQADPFAETSMSPALAFQRLFWAWTEPRAALVDSFPTRGIGIIDWLLHDWSFELFTIAGRFARAWVRGYRLGWPMTYADGRDTNLLERFLTPVAERAVSSRSADAMEETRLRLEALRDELRAEVGVRQVAGEDRPVQLQVADAMFAADGHAIRGQALTKPEFGIVIMGHWHEAYDEVSPGGTRVFNTGTWTRGVIRDDSGAIIDTTKRPYVTIARGASGVEAELLLW